MNKELEQALRDYQDFLGCVVKPKPDIKAQELRDWFAGQALASLVDYHRACEINSIANHAYSLADAMMMAREKCNQAGNS